MTLSTIDKTLWSDHPDSIYVFMGEILAEMPPEPMKLWQEIFIVGKKEDNQAWWMTIYIHRTYVNRIRKSGRVGVINKKSGKTCLTFEEAYRVYTDELVGGMIQEVQEQLNKLLSLKDDIPCLDVFRERVLASLAGVKDNSSENSLSIISLNNESVSDDYTEMLKNPPVPKFTPGEQVYTVILPETHGSYSAASDTERYDSYRYDIISVEITFVEFSVKNGLKYWNASEFLWLGESDFFRTPEEAIARRDEILQEKGITIPREPTFRKYTEERVKAESDAKFSAMVNEVLSQTN